MIKFILALSLVFVNLYACKGGFDSCKLKVKHSNSIQNNTLVIPVLKNKKLIFSRKTPNKEIIKHNPFLSLYLVKESKNFKHPFTINMHLSLGYAAVNSSKAIEGKIKTSQVGLNRLASFSEELFYPSLLTNSCCSLEGLVTPEGIIEKEYINHFIQTKNKNYSDIGIRVKEDNSLVFVESIDPFIENNPFKIGDCIVELNSKKVKNSTTFMQEILFSKIGTKHILKIKRASKLLTIELKTYKRYGGGYISDTFLEQKGIFVNKDLSITKLKSGHEDYGLKLGDKLLRVNNTPTQTQEQVRKNISDYDESASLLIQRDAFQFFVNIK
jgi:hypothetical protein